MSVYSIADYGRMLGDRVRVDAYAAALERAVTPESIVLDLGAGTGFLAVLAARLGAARVYGIESSDAIELAREAAVVNGVADRVSFLYGDSRELELPEQPDLLVCDIRGVLPWALEMVSTLVDARERLLAPGATLIPRRDTLRIAVVEDEEVYGRRADIWSQKPHGVDIEAGRRFSINKWQRNRFEEDQLLSAPGTGAILDYRTTGEPGMVSTLDLDVTREGVGHGLAAWFDCDLAESIGYSSGPGDGASIYQQAFFFWEEPVEMEVGDRVEAELRADCVNGQYVWSWNTRVLSAAGASRAEFRQSNFLEIFPSREHRERRRESHRPDLSQRGRVLLSALEAMRQRRPLGEIAATLAAQHPGRFPSESDALAWVGQLSVRYSR